MESIDPGVRNAFLHRLTEATRAGTITWESSEGRSFWYFADLKNFSYAVESVDIDDAPPFDFHVYREGPDGQHSEVEVWRWERDFMSPTNEFLRLMYISAQGSALGTTNLAKDMFADLAEFDGGPAEPTSLEDPGTLPSEGF